jgi:hypothetical protein
MSMCLSPIVTFEAVDGFSVYLVTCYKYHATRGHLIFLSFQFFATNNTNMEGMGTYKVRAALVPLNVGV